MKKTLLLMTALAAIAAAPAAAQYAPQGNAYARGGVGLDHRIAQLETRLEAGIRAGTIDRREARRLRDELRTLNRLEARYSRDGLSREEHADLQRRIQALRRDIRTADRGSYDRYERYGEWDEYDRGPGYGYGRDAYGRDGYGRDGYYGRGGPDELQAYCSDQVSNGRGGIGGLLEALLGGGSGSLRVGQRVSGNLYAVPHQFRDRYRDGYGLHYRSDGRVVYEIDDRTMTVTRICRMDR